MKSFFTLLFFAGFGFLSAQTTADFENIFLAPESFLNGDNLAGGFSDGNITLINNFNVDYAAWTGFALSNTTDVTTPGFGNQYSCIAGAGAEETDIYAVSYAFDNVFMTLNGDATGEKVNGLFVNNATIATLSMENGDAYAKQFGGPTGNDPDFFLLTIYKFLDGELGTEKVEFYLADYRSDDNTEDYIVKDWTWLDLTSLGKADSLRFSLTSSDVGGFGMNTPAYFCIDRIETSDGVSSSIVGLNEIDVSIYPNPTVDFVNISHKETNSIDVQVYNALGQLMAEQIIPSGKTQIDMSTYSKGTYFLHFRRDGEKGGSKIVVKQ